MWGPILPGRLLLLLLLGRRHAVAAATISPLLLRGSTTAAIALLLLLLLGGEAPALAAAIASLTTCWGGSVLPSVLRGSGGRPSVAAAAAVTSLATGCGGHSLGGPVPASRGAIATRSCTRGPPLLRLPRLLLLLLGWGGTGAGRVGVAAACGLPVLPPRSVLRRPALGLCAQHGNAGLQLVDQVQGRLRAAGVGGRFTQSSHTVLAESEKLGRWHTFPHIPTHSHMLWVGPPSPPCTPHTWHSLT